MKSFHRRTRRLLLVAFASCFLMSAHSPANEKPNITEKYLKISRQGLNYANLAQALRPYHLLLVQGLSADSSYSLQGFLRKVGTLGPNFGDQMRWFDEQQISYDRVRIHPMADPMTNALEILRAANRTEKPILMITHSKGGIDTLEALLTFPAFREKVKGWLSLQSPFHGSPVADFIMTQSQLRALAFGLSRVRGGSPQAILSLTQAYRSVYLLARRKAIQEIVSKIPTVTLGTWKWNTPGIDTIFEPIRNLMEARNYLNDGLVPYRHAILPGAKHVLLSGIDHAGPVQYCVINSVDRIRLTGSLLSILLEQMAPPSS